MRLTLLLLLCATSASAQAPRERITPFGGLGLGVVWDDETGWLATQLNVGARRGLLTAALRASARGQFFSRDERWDAAALGGATLARGRGRLHVGGGPSLSGGTDRGSCLFSSFSCADAPGQALPLRPGLALVAEAGVRLLGRSFLTVQAAANVTTGSHSSAGVTLGSHYEF